MAFPNKIEISLFRALLRKILFLGVLSNQQDKKKKLY